MMLVRSFWPSPPGPYAAGSNPRAQQENSLGGEGLRGLRPEIPGVQKGVDRLPELPLSASWRHVFHGSFWRWQGQIMLNQIKYNDHRERGREERDGWIDGWMDGWTDVWCVYLYIYYIYIEIHMYILHRHTLSWHSPPWQIVCHQERWCRGCSKGASQEFGRSSTAKASSGGVQGRYPRVPDARNGWVCWHCFSIGKPWKTPMETMVLNSFFLAPIKDIILVVPWKSNPEI